MLNLELVINNLPFPSIKAALRSFFSESLTFLSFLPFSIDFNKSLLPFVEGGGILATGGGGGGPGTT